MALCRDVNFTRYKADELTVAATAELSRLTEFSGPRSKDGHGPYYRRDLVQGIYRWRLDRAVRLAASTKAV
jgi:hypothetical protein